MLSMDSTRPDSPLSIAFRHITPTWRNYVFYANQSAEQGDEKMQTFMRHYNGLPPGERRTVTPEELCDLSTVDTGDLIAAVSRQVWRFKHPESVITASMKHPLVLEATADYAINSPYAEKDRELFFRLTGGLPDRKGASIVVNNNPQTANFGNGPSPGAGNYKTMDQRVIEMGKILEDPADSIAVPMSAEDTDLVFAEDDESED
jgi:hypothetical protein